MALGLKDDLLDAGFTRTDPISPPDDSSSFTDLIAWQAYHFVHNVGNVELSSFVFSK